MYYKQKLLKFTYLKSPWEYKNLFDIHYNELMQHPKVFKDFVVGIETRRIGEELKCSIIGKVYNPGAKDELEALSRSFNLDLELLT